MKGILLTAVLFSMMFSAFSQGPAKVREYKKVFRTYPFSDPDPVPDISKIYPYYRFDGYTDVPVNKEWKVVELENDFIKVMILPEIGGKIWAAIEKSTGKSFLYYNQVVKFRDVAMRGPWTSGGIEANYGIVGHTPNCATPVDYTMINREDGSVSCVIGVLDLLTRTTWRIDVNLQKDKAYFTTNSSWYNASPFEQAYYTWMNAGIKAKGNLQFIYPGTKYIGHSGEYSDWPIDSKGRDLSYYENNNFGEYKSYHVFGKYTDFFGGYYHDEDFGMARYSTHDDKAGKKIWIWGLSRQGMIWENLLTDNDGQYVEVQSGRLFNQPAEGSSLTPFKNRSFTPNASDTWTEYWMPVLNTKGFITANNYGAINLIKQKGSLVIYFSPVQTINDELKITDGEKVIYSKKLNLKTLQLFKDSIALTGDPKDLQVKLGDDKINYDDASAEGTLARPVETPADFDWNSVQGLYLQGKEHIRQRIYPAAEEKIRAALKADPYYLPALADLSMLLYRNMKYAEALETAKKALSIDTYDPSANYYYGLINEKLDNIADAKDGFDISSQAIEYRTAAYNRLANLYLKENNINRAIHYAQKSLTTNSASIDALQLLAVIYRQEKNKEAANKILDTISKIDPLNHFSNFERFLWDGSDKNKTRFTSLIQNEMPWQTYLELAIWYYNAGQKEEASKVLALSGPNVEVSYWKSFLGSKALDTADLKPGMVFPFRPETAEVIEKLMKSNDHWLLKYHLGLIQWNSNNIAGAKKLFEQCGEQSDYAPFYAVRAKLFSDGDSAKILADLKRAKSLDGMQWRYSRLLINYYIAHRQNREALAIAAEEYKGSPSNYIIGMLNINALILNKDYAAADKILQKIKVLPNEGSTSGRLLYRETKLMLAINNINSGNCKKALRYMDEARKWPEQLGSGKPYEDDVDERIEDWMSYKCFVKNNAKAATQMLDKINMYTMGHAAGGRPNVNNLVSAWALKNSGKEEEGQIFLKNIADKHPSSVISKWTLEAFAGQAGAVPAEVRENDSYRFLEMANALNP